MVGGGKRTLLALATQRVACAGVNMGMLAQGKAGESGKAKDKNRKLHISRG